MAVKTGNETRDRLTGRLAAFALGTALFTLPIAALAQQDDHRGHDNAAPRQQAPARPAPAPPPRAAPAAAPMDRGGNWRGAGQANGQPRPAPGNPAGNNWQSRPTQQNFAPGQGQPYRGQSQYQGQSRQDQPSYQGRPSYQGQPQGNDGAQWRHNGEAGRNDGGADRHDQGRNDGGQWRGNPGYGRPQGGGEWSHNWRQDNRYDWRGYREANRDTFHAGRYYAPYRGYNYDRLGVGFYLQPLFFGSDYWIADPSYYRLPPAYGPYHWVRYYNDVILVNTYTGQVADVIYDFFW